MFNFRSFEKKKIFVLSFITISRLEWWKMGMVVVLGIYLRGIVPPMLSGKGNCATKLATMYEAADDITMTSFALVYSFSAWYSTYTRYMLKT